MIRRALGRLRLVSAGERGIALAEERERYRKIHARASLLNAERFFSRSALRVSCDPTRGYLNRARQDSRRSSVELHRASLEECLVE